jgi:type IV pilus assembly protein PilE
MKSKGFTLIELMVVVAIIGIIASVAYPSYTGYISNTYQAQASADLKLCALALDRYYSNDFTYLAADENNACIIVSPGNSTPGTQKYSIGFTTLTANNYVIKATPVTLNEAGEIVNLPCNGKCLQLTADGSQTQL